MRKTALASVVNVAVLVVAARASGAAAVPEPPPAGPPQFLTLPRHPRQPDPSGAGILEFEDRFIWRAPLDSGLPPPMSGAPASPGAPVPEAVRTGDVPSNTAGIDASSAPDAYQGETAAAFNGSVLVGGSNSIAPGCATGPCRVRAYATADGASYASTTLPGTWGGATFGITFDPAIDVDAAGTFYYAFGGVPLSGSFPNSIGVARSTDGVTWSTPAAVTFNASGAFDDKYWLAVDRSAGTFAGRIYVSWTRNLSNNQTLYVAWSSDRGATWSAPVKVNDGKTKLERVIWAYPAVDARNGTVYDAWHDYGRNAIFVDRSTSGGAKWGTDVAAATTHTGFGVDIGCVGGRRQTPSPTLKVGPSGTLHLVYADSIAGRGLDVLYARSTDGGRSWSAPVRLDDDAGAADQFHPTLSVASNGAGGDRLSVTFYDRRDDAANCAAHVYAAVSADGGRTWSPNARLTTAPSSFDGNANGPGDYSSSAPSFAAGTTAFHAQKAGADFDVYAFPF